MKITPSITISGSFPPLMERWPRTCKDGAWPAPCSCPTVKPATVPRNVDIGLELGNKASGELFIRTVLTAPVKFFRFTEPYPTTTTSSSSSVSSFNCTCKGRAVASSFHQGNGQGPRCNNVARTRSIDHTKKTTGDDGYLCRASSGTTCGRISKVHEKWCGTRKFKKSTKKNE